MSDADLLALGMVHLTQAVPHSKLTTWHPSLLFKLIRYSAKWGKYGQTTVTIKKSQLERKTTQATINSNPLGCTNLLSRANPKNHTKERKIPPQESPTLQVAKLTRYRTNLPSSIHKIQQSLCCAVFPRCPCRGDGEKAWEK